MVICHPHQVKDGDGLFGAGVSQPQRHLLLDSHSPRLLTLPPCSSHWEDLPVQGSVHKSSYSTPSRYQSVHYSSGYHYRRGL